MKPVFRSIAVALALTVGALVPSAAFAQIEGNLSSYTGENAQGYLEPLKDAIGSALNTGLYTSGRVPAGGFHLRLEVRGMLVSFADEDRVFQASTEDYYPDAMTVEAPTVVGDLDAVTVTDSQTGASFAFPGGLDMDRFALAAPQIVVGGVMGSEAIVRYFAMETGDAEIGDISLFGIGVRHSISQYFEGLPVDLAGLVFWQNFKIGEKLLDASAFTFGLQGSKSFGILEPYVGLSMDSFQMDLEYDTDINGETETLAVEYDRDNGAHVTLGSALHLGFLHLNGELNIADQTGFAVGVGVGR